MTETIPGMKQTDNHNADQDYGAHNDDSYKPENANQANHAHPQEPFHTRERAFVHYAPVPSPIPLRSSKIILLRNATALRRGPLWIRDN
jgi:hypothetical protein